MRVVKRFIEDQNGQFAIMTSIMLVPIALAVGLVIDYTNVSRTRVELQNSADAAVLAVAEKGDSINDLDAQILGDSFVDGNFDPEYTNLEVKRVGTDVSVNAKTQVKLYFGGLIGKSSVELNVSAASAIAYASYEIALALDTTGSMEGGKIASMKDAVTAMIDTMAAQNQRPGALKFSIVPFSSMVNVGPQFGPAYNGAGAVTRQPAAWLDMMARSPIDQSDLDPGVSRFAMYKHLGVQWPGCVETRPVAGGVDYGTNDAMPDASNPETLFVPAFASDEPDWAGFPNNYMSDMFAPIGSWSVPARMARYGASYPGTFKTKSFSQQIADSSVWQNRLTDFSNQTYYSNYPVNKGPDFGCDVQPISPLSSDFSALKAKVNSLMAMGSTNTFEGAAWGWRTLTADAPFTEGAPSSNTIVKKTLVLLTDGTNNLGQLPNSLGSTYSSFGYLVDGRLGMTGGSASQIVDAMNARTLAVCDNAKAQGIEIYTIRLEEPNVTTGNMLRDCASDVDHYFDVPNRALLDDAFAKIKDKIALIRISS
jgi:Flp pilus assembly protein TadG